VTIAIAFDIISLACCKIYLIILLSPVFCDMKMGIDGFINYTSRQKCGNSNIKCSETVELDDK
jgi:hypothetical protein